MDDLGVLVNDLIVNGDILADHCTGQNNTVLNYGALLDHASASDHGIFHGSFDQASVGDNRILHAAVLKVLCRAGIVGARVDRPVLVKQAGCRLAVDQGQVCVIVALEICDRREVSAMRNSPDVQLFAFLVYNLRQRIHGGNLSCLFNQLYKQVLLHHIGIHGNVPVLCGSPVLLDRQHALLLVQVQQVAVQIHLLRIVYGMIQHRNVCFGFDMCLKQGIKILCEHHKVRRDDHILLMHSLNAVNVLIKCRNIRIVDVILRTVL